MIDKALNRRFIQGMYSAFTAVFVLFIIVIGMRGKSQTVENTCYRINLEGSYSLDGGSTFNELNNNAPIAITGERSMIIRGHFDRYIDGKRPIYMFVQGLKVKVFINNKLILNHNDGKGGSWTYFTIDSIAANDDVYIELSMDDTYLYNVQFGKFVNRIFEADRYGLIMHLFAQYFIHIIVCLVILILGAGILIYFECFKGIKDYNSEGLISCGMMMITGSLTCFADNNYITLLVRNLYYLRFSDLIMQSLLVMFIAAYLKRYVSSRESKKRCYLIVFTMVTFFTIYMIRYILTDSIQDFDWLFICFVVAVIALLCIELRDVYIEGLNMPGQNRLAFDSMVLLVLAIIIEMFYYIMTGTFIVRVLEICMLVFSIMQYYLLVSTNVDNYHQAQRARELENELTQNKVKLMLGQIQPHFLYNAIGTIRALCVREPKEARNALDYFAKYLRANMDSITEEGCIPFTKELDHVKSYLYIEKLRFGDLLTIEYDIRTTGFECPPLTLQTMVENAVKHGLLPKKEGGKLKITTLETADYFELKVEDDGVGFDSAKPLEEGRSHIGVENTRQRVMALCNGTLNIGSRLGEGTTITITIPKKKTQRG